MYLLKLIGEMDFLCKTFKNMTSQEKANELYNDFYNISLNYVSDEVAKRLSKECTMYLVNEKLAILQNEYMYGETLPIKEIQYWTETINYLTIWGGEQHS